MAESKWSVCAERGVCTKCRGCGACVCLCVSVFPRSRLAASSDDAKVEWRSKVKRKSSPQKGRNQAAALSHAALVCKGERAGAPVCVCVGMEVVACRGKWLVRRRQGGRGARRKMGQPGVGQESRGKSKRTRHTQAPPPLPSLALHTDTALDKQTQSVQSKW